MLYENKNLLFLVPWWFRLWCWLRNCELREISMPRTLTSP